MDSHQQFYLYGWVAKERLERGLGWAGLGRYRMLEGTVGSG